MTSGTKRLYKPQKNTVECIFCQVLVRIQLLWRRAKSSNGLREMIISFQRTHVTVKRQMQCFVIVEPNIYVEGRFNKILKYIAFETFCLDSAW